MYTARCIERRRSQRGPASQLKCRRHSHPLALCSAAHVIDLSARLRVGRPGVLVAARGSLGACLRPRRPPPQAPHTRGVLQVSAIGLLKGREGSGQRHCRTCGRERAHPGLAACPKALGDGQWARGDGGNRAPGPGARARRRLVSAANPAPPLLAAQLSAWLAAAPQQNDSRRCSHAGALAASSPRLP